MEGAIQMAETTSPGLRVDAERNRLALVCAAAAVFARSGTSAPLDEIAREAKVGIATLYRRFPDRDSLLEAVFEEKMRDYADRAAAAAELARTEPWRALEEYVLHMMSEQAADPAFADVVSAPTEGSRLFVVEHQKALRSTIILVERAKAAKVVRDDFEHADLLLLSLANAGLSHNAGDSALEASRRLCAYMLESFKPAQSAPLPAVPAAWASTARRRAHSASS
jgi:AcrR family transcriptional regulator